MSRVSRNNETDDLFLNFDVGRDLALDIESRDPVLLQFDHPLVEPCLEKDKHIIFRIQLDILYLDPGPGFITTFEAVGGFCKEASVNS